MLQRTEISSLQYAIALEIQELLAYLCRLQMVVVAQLVRAPGCGPGGRRFETDLPPKKPFSNERLFLFLNFLVEPHCSMKLGAIFVLFSSVIILL